MLAEGQNHRSLGQRPGTPIIGSVLAEGQAHRSLGQRPGTPIIGSVLAEGQAHRSLGQRPRNGSTTGCLAERHIHTWEPRPQVSLAFSQTCSMASISWGVAPGYGDYGLRPTAMLDHSSGALPQATVSRNKCFTALTLPVVQEQARRSLYEVPSPTCVMTWRANWSAAVGHAATHSAATLVSASCISPSNGTCNCTSNPRPTKVRPSGS